MNYMDYGCDPAGDGTFRLVPSGRIVTDAERLALFSPTAKPMDDCFGLSWDEIERKQGGKLTRLNKKSRAPKRIS